MQYSEREQIAHVVRRLGLGGSPDVVAASSSVGDAISRSLDLSEPSHELIALEAPASLDDVDNLRDMLPGVVSWIESAVIPTRLIEERMTWFWHDHFATSLRKVPVPYAMWQQHLTLRQHATGNFRDLLSAVATDPAMLAYLDGFQNSADAINENFGREVMELHTIGPGHYTETDVYEAARSFSGWLINVPGRRRNAPEGVAAWTSYFVDRRHDSGTKTLLGVTGNHNMADALDILLDHPATRPRIAAKLYESLVGMAADPTTVDHLVTKFADYDIMALVEAIAELPAFVSDDAIRNQVRNPFERLITLVQGIGQHHSRWQTRLTRNIQQITIGFIPFVPPNPAGYPEGTSLLGPHALVHSLDMLLIVDQDAAQPDPTGMAYLNQMGVYDIAPETAATIANASSPQHQLALAIGSPEMLLT